MARGLIKKTLDWLEGNKSAQLSHSDLKDEIVHRGRETQCLAFQVQLGLRSLRPTSCL